MVIYSDFNHPENLYTTFEANLIDMKKIFFLVLFICLVITACNTATPGKYFDTAVLNCNMMMGFANEGLLRELDQPSVKMVNGDKDHTVAMKRKEVIDTKIKFLEANLEELKQLKETPDTRDILQASLALNEYILPVYKNEYLQLAKLYDDGASKEARQSMSMAIRGKYFTGFDERFSKLTTAGKSYAERHAIKVTWDR
jgi:hypothetical protein